MTKLEIAVASILLVAIAIGIWASTIASYDEGYKDGVSDMQWWIQYQLQDDTLTADSLEAAMKERCGWSVPDTGAGG